MVTAKTYFIPVLLAILNFFPGRAFSSDACSYTGEGKELIGTKAPEWENLTWLNSPPLTLKNLKGNVVLIRFWTNGCPYCKQTAPALNEFYKAFKKEGFTLIGMYHPKPPGDVPAQDVKKFSQKLGFQFPVALDNDWETLTRYWLKRNNRGWTSVSFLLDRNGIIRAIHPGGEYHQSKEKKHEACDVSYRQMKKCVEMLLKKRL